MGVFDTVAAFGVATVNLEHLFRTFNVAPGIKLETGL